MDDDKILDRDTGWAVEWCDWLQMWLLLDSGKRIIDADTQKHRLVDRMDHWCGLIIERFYAWPK